MAFGKALISVNDYDPERSTVTVKSAELTAANFDAQVAAFTSFRDALAGITEGLMVSHELGIRNEIVGPKTPASAKTAQRERKWLVRYHAATGGDPFTMELPCADLAALDPNNRGFAEIGDGGVVDAFVSAFEAFVKTESGGNVLVDSIAHVGRNV